MPRDVPGLPNPNPLINPSLSSWFWNSFNGHAFESFFETFESLVDWAWK